MATSPTPTDTVPGISWLKSWVEPRTGKDAICLQFSSHPSHSPVTKLTKLSRLSFRYYSLPAMHKQIVWQFYFGTELEDPHMHQHLNGRCTSRKLSAQNSVSRKNTVSVTNNVESRKKRTLTLCHQLT